MTSGLYPMPGRSPQQKIDQMAAVAVSLEAEVGYPPQLLLSQWALESGWGASESGVNNYFGMTKAKRHSDWKWCATREVLSQRGINDLDPEEHQKIRSTRERGDGKFDVHLSRRFASYLTLLDGVKDKVNLIVNGLPYKAAFAAFTMDHDVMKLIDGIAKAGYATDPNYAATLKKIAVQKNVVDAIVRARV